MWNTHIYLQISISSRLSTDPFSLPCFKPEACGRKRILSDFFRSLMQFLFLLLLFVCCERKSINNKYCRYICADKKDLCLRCSPFLRAPKKYRMKNASWCSYRHRVALYLVLYLDCVTIFIFIFNETPLLLLFSWISNRFLKVLSEFFLRNVVALL